MSNAAEVLRVIKEQLEQQVPRPRYELLVRPLTAIALDQGRLTLGISNEVLRGWLIDQLGEQLEILAELTIGEPVEVVVSVVVPVAAGNSHNTGNDSPSHFSRGRGTPESGLTAPQADDDDDENPETLQFPAEPVRRPLLNTRYRFDTFVVGASNQFCYSACWQVAQRPGQSYNPLFLYAGVGLGKTHLMHSIGHAMWQRENKSRVVYVTSEKFTNDFIEHVRTGRMPELHARYRQADVLMIDDIQFLSGKPETQIEFFHTFMHLVEAGKQIVISSDRPPRTLKGIEDRLISRFSMGLVADIGDPSLETRVAILQRKAELENVHLPDEVCHYIAERVASNVRELEGALNRLLAYCNFGQSLPTVEVAAKLLKDFVSQEGVRTQLTLKQIMGVVSEYFNVSEQLLLSPNRSKRVALARMIVMYFAREYTNLTLSQIGNELGGRDHSTISHGANKIGQDVLEDPYIEQAVTQIARLLK